MKILVIILFMFSTRLFAADDDHVQILNELLKDLISEKKLEVCDWILEEAYPEYLNEIPSGDDVFSAFYVVVGGLVVDNGRCVYGFHWDSNNKSLQDVKQKAKAECEHWRKENQITGTCKLFAIGKEIVWEGSIINAEKNSVVSNETSGCIHGNCENGLGTFIWDNGDQYVGAWKDGKPHGEGTFDWRNRTKYVGEWRDGKKHGYGTHSFYDGSNHIGKWKNGKKHGWVMSTGGNMGVQVYEWKDGVRGEWFGHINWGNISANRFKESVNIITKKDPTTFQNLIFVEEKLMDFFDGRLVSSLVTTTGDPTVNITNYFIFKATFEKGHNVTVAVNAEFKTKGKAEKTALKYIKIVGQLPTFLREGVDFIVIHKGNENWTGGAGKIYIHTGQRQKKFIEEIMVHEAGHAALDWYGAGTVNRAEWATAQLADKKFISEYAENNMDREDVAETIIWWIAVRCKQDRVSKKNYKKVLEAIPNRLKYFDEKNYDTYPLVCNFE